MSASLVDKKITPAVDIIENDIGYNLKLDMPGSKREDISITLSEGKLEIEGVIVETVSEDETLKYRELSAGKYYRGFTLGADIEPDGGSAKY